MDDGAGHMNVPNQTDLASLLVFRAVLFASRQIWRACSSHLNQTCMREDLLPILRGGIEFYMRAPFDLNGTLTPRGPIHRAVYHDAAGRIPVPAPQQTRGSRQSQTFFTQISSQSVILEKCSVTNLQCAASSKTCR